MATTLDRGTMSKLSKLNLTWKFIGQSGGSRVEKTKDGKVVGVTIPPSYKCKILCNLTKKVHAEAEGGSEAEAFAIAAAEAIEKGAPSPSSRLLSEADRLRAENNQLKQQVAVMEQRVMDKSARV